MKYIRKTIFHFFCKNSKISISNIDENSSDISEVSSHINSLFLNDNEALGLYFDKDVPTETCRVHRELKIFPCPLYLQISFKVLTLYKNIVCETLKELGRNSYQFF